MPNRWIEFVKKWSKDNNTSYGCALTKPEMKAEYHYRYPKVKTKGVAKLEESRPPADVKSKVTYPNLKINIPEEQENIQFDMEEMGAEEPAQRKRGRPQVHMTAEEQYKAKLESNKQKRREKKKLIIEEDDDLPSLYNEYLALHRAKYTNKVQKSLELVEDKINKIIKPLLKAELEQNFFTDEKNQKIRFKLIQPKKRFVGYTNLYLSFTNENGDVIENLTKNGIENPNTDPYEELLSAIQTKYRWRLFNRTAGLRNEEDLQKLLPNLL